MAIRRLDLLITEARRETENLEFSENIGISDEEFIRYANDAQTDLQSAISNVHGEVFQAEEIVSVTANQEVVPIPDDAFLTSRIDFVEFSDTGLVKDYRQIKQGRFSERLPGIDSTPSFYIRRSGVILLQPTPDSSGTVRFTYQKRLPRLDIRRARVGAVSLTSNAITSLTLDTTVAIDEAMLEEENYFTVVDKDGAIKMRRIEFSDIDATTGAVTIDPGFTFESGETISVGDYLCRSSEATTHSQLPDRCEQYLVAFMEFRALQRDSSNDAPGKAAELSQIKASIVEAFAEPDTDVDYVTILDPQYLTQEDIY